MKISRLRERKISFIFVRFFPRLCPTIILILLFAVILVDFSKVQAAVIPLKPILDSADPGDIVTLDSANSYTLSQYNLSKNLTLQGDNAIIDQNGPFVVTGAGTLVTIEQCDFQLSPGWSPLVANNASNLVIRNCAISKNGTGGTGIYVSGATLVVSDTTITAFNIGVNIESGGVVELTGLTVTNCKFGVLVSGAASSVTIDLNSSFTYLPVGGSGVGIMDGASAIIRNSSLEGFNNAVNVLPSTPGGTVKVIKCFFKDNNVSALCVVSSEDVLFSQCRVEGAKTDGIYFEDSTGIVEYSEIIGSLNTGVTFWDCPDGAIIRNCLVKGSVHQGVASVVGSDIQILNNTLVDNTITNVLVDGASTAQFQGNICYQTTAFTPSVPSIRLHGPPNVIIDSTLVIDSYAGVEIKDGSDPTFILSNISGNDNYGALVYGPSSSSSLTVEHSNFWMNGAASWSIRVDDELDVNGRYCSLGPGGDNAFRSNNSGTVCDMSNNYWAASDGPQVPRRGEGTIGSILDWPSGWGATDAVTYSSYLSEAPVESYVDSNISLPTGGSLNWNSTLGVTLKLNAEADSEALTEEVLGVMRVNDTSSLISVTPPDDLLTGQLYVVWVSTYLSLNSASRSMEINLPSVDGNVRLQRRNIDGTWTKIMSAWDPIAHILIFAPDNVYALNGTFAITSIETFYIEPLGVCGGKLPCYPDILAALGSAGSETWFEIAGGSYSDAISLSTPKTLRFRGGWNPTFTNIGSTSTISDLVTISDGKLEVRNIILQ